LKLRYKFLASLLLGLVILWLIFLRLDLQSVSEAIKNANPLFLLAAIFFLFCSIGARVITWGILLNSKEPIKSRYLLSTMLMGYFVNIFIPARFGEFVRCYALSRKTTLPITYILGTVVIEKVLDIGILLAFFMVFCLFFNFAPWLVNASYILLIIVIAFTLFLILSIRYTDRIIGPISGILKKFPRFSSSFPVDVWLRSTILGFQTLQNPVKLLKALVWTLISWIAGLSTSACVVLSLGIEPWLPSALLALVITNLGMLIPVTPGYIGIYQYMALLGLGMLGVNSTLAMSYGIISYIIIFGTFTIAGGIAFWISGIDIMDLYNKQK